MPRMMRGGRTPDSLTSGGTGATDAGTRRVRGRGRGTGGIANNMSSLESRASGCCATNRTRSLTALDSLAMGSEVRAEPGPWPRAGLSRAYAGRIMCLATRLAITGRHHRPPSPAADDALELGERDDDHHRLVTQLVDRALDLTVV